MKTLTKKYLPTGSAFTEENKYPTTARSWGGGAATGPVSLRVAEILRRRAYLRLAREVGISWLACRRTAASTR
jgi:hypothetical protein